MLLNKAIELHINSQKNRNVAENTLKKISYEMSVFETYLSANELEYSSITKFDIEAYVGSTTSSPMGFNDRLGYVNRFYKYISPENNPTASILKAIIPKENRDEIKAIPSAKELMVSLKNQDKTSQLYKRNLAMVSLFLETGIRTKEMAGLTLADIDFKNESFEVYRKGRKYQTLYLPKTSAKLLKEYIKERTEYANDNDFLIVSKKGNAYNPNSLVQELKKLLANNGLSEYSGHALRHRAITDMLFTLELDLETVRIIAGHSDIKVTQRYLNVTDEEANKKMAVKMKQSKSRW